MPKYRVSVQIDEDYEITADHQWGAAVEAWRKIRDSEYAIRITTEEIEDDEAEAN